MTPTKGLKLPQEYIPLDTRHLPLGVFSLTDKGHPYWLIWQYPLILWSRVLPFDLNCCRKQYCLWNWGSRAKKPLRSGKNRARAFSACFEYACCEPPLLLLDPFSLHWQSTWPGPRAGELCKNILEIGRQANLLPSHCQFTFRGGEGIAKKAWKCWQKWSAKEIQTRL